MFKFIKKFFKPKTPKLVCTHCQKDFSFNANLFGAPSGGHCKACIEILGKWYANLGKVNNSTISQYAQPILTAMKIYYSEPSQYGVSILCSDVKHKLSNLIPGLVYKRIDFEKGEYYYNDLLVGYTLYQKHNILQHQIFFNISEIKKVGLLSILNKIIEPKDLDLESLIEKYQPVLMRAIGDPEIVLISANTLHITYRL